MPGKKRFFVKQNAGSSSSSSSSGSRSLRRVSDGRVAAKRMKGEQFDDSGRYRIDAECDALSEFVRTGRTGRRNALPSTAESHDLTEDPVSYVQVSDLPDTLARMSCSSIGAPVSNGAPTATAGPDQAFISTNHHNGIEHLSLIPRSSDSSSFAPLSSSSSLDPLEQRAGSSSSNGSSSVTVVKQNNNLPLNNNHNCANSGNVGEIVVSGSNLVSSNNFSSTLHLADPHRYPLPDDDDDDDL